MKHTYRLWAAAGLLLAAFLLLTLAVLTVDVQPIGPEGSSVGLATLNGAAHRLLGVIMTWYAVTDWLGLASLAVALGFALLGLCQLVHRRSLLRVDMSVLLLGGLYALLIAAYAFFELCIVNYRPILMDGVLEASYPSSHTMLTVGIMASAMVALRRLLPGRRALRRAADVSGGLVIGITVVGRLLSGVHWLTDIVAGVLLASALVLAYAALSGRFGAR
ncbi:MAG: phosphatase PAP2 family protein [Candidatus Ventricola sp.]